MINSGDVYKLWLIVVNNGEKHGLGSLYLSFEMVNGYGYGYVL